MLPQLISAIDGFGAFKEYSDPFVYIVGGMWYNKKLVWASYYDVKQQFWKKMKDMNHSRFCPGIFIS